MANIENCFIKLNVNFTTASGWLQRLVRSSVSPIVICCIWHAIWASSKKVVSLWVFDAGGAVNILMIPRIYQCSLVDEQPQPLLRGRVRPIPVSVRTKTTFELLNVTGKLRVAARFGRVAKAVNWNRNRASCHKHDYSDLQRSGAARVHRPN